MQKSKSNRYFHVTPRKNLSTILQQGLIAQIGERSKKAGEKVSAVYLFSTTEDMENAMSNWLGDEFGDEKCIILKLDIPETFPLKPDKDMYETICHDNISPEYITGIQPFD